MQNKQSLLLRNQIPKNWREDNLENLLDILIDHRGITPKKLGGDWSISGIPALSAKNIKTGKIVNQQDIRFVNQKLYEKWMPKKLEDGDILLTSEAPLGELYFLKERQDYVLSQRLFVLRTNREKLNSRYLYYYLQSSIGRQELLRRLSGTAAEGIRQAELRKINVEFPEDILEQEKIAFVISAFDDKVEVNNKIAKTLEEMAQALFKEWFVYFRFPGYEKAEFADSELGRIPKGWQLKTFGQVATNYDRKRKPLSNMERFGRKGTYPYYGATEIMDYIDEYIFDGEYLLIAEDGTVETGEGKAVLQFIEGKFWVNNHAHIIQGTDEAPTFYLYLFFRNISIKPYITGAVQLKLTQENLNKIPVIIPSFDVMKQFINIVYPMILEIRKCQEENQKLAALRDLLLPKLMKGKIRI